MSVAHYQCLRDAVDRRESVEEALASVRAEGLEPSPLGLRLLGEVAAGEMNEEQAIAQLDSHYAR